MRLDVPVVRSPPVIAIVNDEVTKFAVRRTRAGKSLALYIWVLDVIYVVVSSCFYFVLAKSALFNSKYWLY